MFGNDKDKKAQGERAYLEIMETVSANIGAWFPKMNRDTLAEYNKNVAHSTSINLRIADETKTSTDLNWLLVNQVTPIFDTALDKLIGLCVQSPAELETLYAGLALNAMAYNGEAGVKVVQTAYRQHPNLVIIRLLELVTVTSD